MGRQGNTCGPPAPRSTSAPQQPMGKEAQAHRPMGDGVPRVALTPPPIGTGLGLDVLSLSLPTPPPPAQWRAGRGRHPRGAAREARARRPRPANGRTCSIELAPLLPRRRWRTGRGGGGRSEQGRPPSHHPASHDNGAATSRRPHRTTCLGEGGGRGCALKGAGGQSRTAAPAGSPAPGAGYP